jgi:hypothetical protein
MRPAGNGSDHHRYGEVKTRLTIDASHAFANLLPHDRGAILAAALPAKPGRDYPGIDARVIV